MSEELKPWQSDDPGAKAFREALAKESLDAIQERREFNYTRAAWNARIAGLREAVPLVRKVILQWGSEAALEALMQAEKEIRAHADALEREAGGTKQRFTDATEQEGGV